MRKFTEDYMNRIAEVMDSYKVKMVENSREGYSNLKGKSKLNKEQMKTNTNVVRHWYWSFCCLKKLGGGKMKNI